MESLHPAWQWIHQDGSRPTLQRDTWLWDNMSLNSSGCSTLQCGMWLWNHDSAFAQWQHIAMWHVALGSWHWIRQVAAPPMWQVALEWRAIELAQTSAILEFYFLFRFRLLASQSTCHSAPVCEIFSKSDHPRQKKMTSCRFSRWRISAILDFSGPIISYLKSPCTTSYR